MKKELSITANSLLTGNILMSALLAGMLILGVSCTKTPGCELNNTGTIVVKNFHPHGFLQIHVDKNNVPANASGDLSVKAGEEGSLELPAGKHNIKAILVITTCSGGRCSVSTSGQGNDDINLASCETKNLIY